MAAGDGDVLSATTTPQALTGDFACTQVIVQCGLDETGDLYVGFVTAQPMHLRKGDRVTIPVVNANLVYVKSGAGTVSANWLAITGTA